MTAALLLAAVALLGLGSAACAANRTFRAGLAVQAVGAALLGAAGFWALAAGTTFGSSFTNGFTPRFGVDGLTAFFLGTLGLVAAPTLAFASRYLDSGPRGRVTAVSHRRVRSHTRGGPVRARPDDVPRRVGADDAAAGGVDPRRPLRRCRATVGLPLHRRHPHRRRGHVDRDPARRACGSPRRRSRRRARLRPPDRDRADRARRHGDEGRCDAAAQLAAARASDRACAGLGA